MKKELYTAEKELQSAHAKVLQLRETIAKKEIARIQNEVKGLEGTIEEKLDFLDLSRKNISSIMNEVPTCICEAQEVLDEILVAITELKEQKKSPR
ncbi:MAG: hypothetical protein H7A36_05955 [Chlamydiales bacterium]|nr:hypothetical protein [Chlamydiales bacterium]